jgi:bacterioferritin (cytochrome b1)
MIASACRGDTISDGAKESAEPKKRSGSMASVSDLTYDLLTVLQSKLEACAAYDMYMKDVQQAGDKEAQSLLASLKRDDEKHIEELVSEIERRAREGKLR